MQKAIDPAILFRHASASPEILVTDHHRNEQSVNNSANAPSEGGDLCVKPNSNDRAVTSKTNGTATVGEKYIKLDKIGEGTYGVVYKAVTATKRNIVALKKVYDPKKTSATYQEGIPAASLREMIALKMLCHPNIVGLLDIVTQERCIYVVLEYMSTDLAQVLDGLKKQNLPGLPERDVMIYSYQMLSALAYCHERRMMHRDLKPQNILVEPQKKAIKIADFGLARSFKNAVDVPITCEVVTLWYRAPEILLGCKMYTTSIDIWSTGFIVAEMISGVPFAAGDSEINQLYKIFQIFGTPSSDAWPGIAYHPYYEMEWPAWRPKSIRELLPRATAVQIDLIKCLCRYKPSERLRARQAVKLSMFDFVRSQASPSNVDEKCMQNAAVNTGVMRRRTAALSCTQQNISTDYAPSQPAALPTEKKITASTKRHSSSAAFPHDASVYYSTPEYSFTNPNAAGNISVASSSSQRLSSGDGSVNDSGLGSSGSGNKGANSINNKRRACFNIGDDDDDEEDALQQPFIGTDLSYYAGQKRRCTVGVESRSQHATMSNFERSSSSRPASRAPWEDAGSSSRMIRNYKTGRAPPSFSRDDDEAYVVGHDDNARTDPVYADDDDGDLSLAATDDDEYPSLRQQSKHQNHATFLGGEGARDAIRDRTHGLHKRSMSNAVCWPKDMLSTYRT